MSTPLLQLDDVRVHFTLADGLFGSKVLKAVDGISFTLEAGQTLGVVGESGCGKSTLARAILGIHPPTSGRIWLEGEELTGKSRRELRPYRQAMQVVFQDPLASLNPRMTVGEAIAEPLRVFKPEMSAADRRGAVRRLMDLVGLLPNQINRYPHEFSGGQCQRIGIARALAVEPKLLLCDEPVSALDVSIQAQIVNLLMDLQQEMGLAMVFIAHDLAVVRHISDEVLVMYLGRAMEQASRDELYARPQHPYTQALIDAVPIPDPVRERAKTVTLLRGDLPSPLAPPSGCVFRTRCPRAEAICADSVPGLIGSQQGNSRVACKFA
ncbi:MAG: dipeptide ABC transporter ATP-binding protein [Oceanococcaceae bacterium]